MAIFNAQASYDPRRNVRDPTKLVELLGSLPQEGVLFPLVGARRAGKTWALRAVESALKQRPGRTVRYVDLRYYGSGLPDTLQEDCLLLDEPELTGTGKRVREPAAFLRWCKSAYESNKVLLLAMSPAEWAVLQQADESVGLVSSRQLTVLDPLKALQAERLARTEQARRILARLDEPWKRNPFLLELVFQVAEEQGDDAENDLWELLRQTRDRSDDSEFFYFQAVYWNGLTEAQRETLRNVAHAAPTKKGELEFLMRCGLVAMKEKHPAIADPILDANLCPLRIHHISDLHFGPKSAERVDVKEKGTHADRFALGLGPKPVRDLYLQYVEGLKSSGKAPHVLVISGDIAEWADDAQYAEARPWLDALRGCLAEHPRLRPTEPHVLLVGGNHDVDWRQTEGPAGAGARKRHVPFARAFHDVPRSLRVRLDEPPVTRPLAVARYEDLDVEVLLLGSSEFGGEAEQDPVREQLLAMVERLWKEALAKPDEERARALRDQVSRLDPGLVHDADLERVGKESWSRSLRIAVLHHPVSPLPATELGRYVGLINAGEVKDRLMKNGFSLVLHGHAHTGWFGKEEWPGRHESRALWIASAPSLGSREIQEKNGFNEIEISRSQKGRETIHSVTVRRYVREGTSWAQEAEMRFERSGA
jgi:hypothetical protein